MSRPESIANIADRSQPAVRVRRMEVQDVATVMAVELAAYEFPWTDGIFRDCIRVGYWCRLVEHDNEMVGYAVMSVGAGEAHILNLCVRLDMRGRGYGRLLLAEAIEQACMLGAETMFLEVRPSNHSARALYEKIGFNEVGVRTAYYPARNGREDALILALAITINRSPVPQK